MPAAARKLTEVRAPRGTRAADAPDRPNGTSRSAQLGALAGRIGLTRLLMATVIGAALCASVIKIIQWVSSAFKGAEKLAAATAVIPEEAALRTGAEAFGKFAVESGLPIGALGKPDHSLRLLWCFSGLAPQVYLPNLGASGLTRHLKAELEATGNFLVVAQPDNALSVINIAAATAVMTKFSKDAGVREAFGEEAVADPKKFLAELPTWMAQPDGQLRYGLLSGIPYNSALEHAKRWELYGLAETSKKAAKTDIEAMKALLLKTEWAPDDATAMKTHFTAIFTADPTVFANPAVRAAIPTLMDAPHPTPAGAPLQYETYSVKDDMVVGAQIRAARTAVSALTPELQATLKISEYAATGAALPYQ